MKHTEDIFNVVAGNSDTKTKRITFEKIDREDDSKDEYNRLKNTWALLACEKEMPAYKVEEMYLDFKQQLDLRKPGRRINIALYLKYAAIILVTIGLTSILFYTQNFGLFKNHEQVHHTTVVAENGQRSKVILPDSTVVWLNSGTTITYNSDFARKNRDIKLVGQAFFQVTRNRDLPMLVSCGDLWVKVLGTRFDVNGYNTNKAIEVSLSSGSIELLHSNDEKFICKLSPGEKAEYNVKSGNVSVQTVNLDRVAAWIDGILYFNDSPMRDVLEQLERKYNIEIEVKYPQIYKSVFTATIKNESLEEIFKSIEYSCLVRCQIVRGKEDTLKTKVIIEKQF